ncbi:hypothetical protein GWO53_00175 [Corynebacterium macginleyi]|uniref:YtxH domain-containing protein n=1 Tax=Corynebacterium macginleyi TaxID=38290 RepID=A0A3M0GQI3_9CORY|nr:hypothetical protein [Corynebacterium macginleyi]MBK4138975.1 hypothetical protein [Corynebacterium macginleyi]MBK4142709.1 hypothetical protein [Corynebacterium macginleyi]MBK4148720.1 hypothetical protein [Corynebacterium macginleyi]MBK4149934.1 hypothetical protein [Corynebacterium macginleyi]MBK4156798.1 hypothetical protein [Corynebacterium macginleyi]
MIQFVFGAAAGYVFGTKAGRKRYHQIKGAYEKTVNSPAAKSAVRSARKVVANRLDPEPRMREIHDLSEKRRGRGKTRGNRAPQADRIYEPDKD